MFKTEILSQKSTILQKKLYDPRLLISSFFDAMNFQHFSEVL